MKKFATNMIGMVIYFAFERVHAKKTRYGASCVS
jgi:hypothetical protein